MSSPRSAAAPNRANAIAIASSGSPNVVTPHPSTATSTLCAATPVHRDTVASAACCTGCSGALVAQRGRAGVDGVGEHGRVLSRAVVVETRGMVTGILQRLRAALRQRLMRPACEVAFLQADRLEHLRGDRDVLGLSRVRRACERELVVAPPERVQRPGCDERRRLHWFRGRPPRGDEARVAGRPDEIAAPVHDRRVHAVTRLDDRAPRRDDVEVVANACGAHLTAFSSAQTCDER